MAVEALLGAATRLLVDRASAWKPTALRDDVTAPCRGEVFLGLSCLARTISARTSQLASVVLRHNLHRGMPATAWAEVTDMVPGAVGGAPCLLRDGDEAVSEWAVALPRVRLTEALGSLYARTALSHVAVFDSWGGVLPVDWMSVCQACGRQMAQPSIQRKSRWAEWDGSGSEGSRRGGVVPDSQPASRAGSQAS